MSMATRTLRNADAMARLPPAAVTKLENMRDAAAVAFHRNKSNSEAMRDALAVRNGIESERVEVMGRPHMDADARAKHLAKIDAALRQQNLELAKIRKKAEAAEAAVTIYAAPVRNLEEWLELRRNDVLRPHLEEVKPKRKPNEEWADLVARLRARLAALSAERHHVASAPIPAEEAKAAMRREVEGLAEAGAPDVTGCLEGGGLHWPTTSLTRGDGSVLTYSAIDARAVLMWLHRDQLIARLDAEIDALADPETAMTDSRRRAEDERLLSEMLAIERQEEAAIVSASLSEVIIGRRPDADPRAVLELADSVPGYDEDG